MSRNVVAIISRSALHHNLQRVRKIAPHSKILAMVKANAYGHGLAEAAKTLEDADALGVASIEEALILRERGIQAPIVLMEGIFRPEELILVQAYHLTMVVHDAFQIQAIKEYSGAFYQHFKIWIKINTGMNRLGFVPEDFAKAQEALSNLSRVDVIGFMTHFSSADEKNSPFTREQTDTFQQVVGEQKGAKCLANSAAILHWPQTHADWVRPGLILYGASPFSDTLGQDYGLKPVMSLQSEIIAIRKLSLCDKVGYGRTWESLKDNGNIAIVAIGYGDGYPWHAKNGTPVLVNGQRAYLIGRVSMDMLAIDISHLADVNIGDPVRLWGEGLPIEEVARYAGTIPYELFCRFTERVTVQVVS